MALASDGPGPYAPPATVISVVNGYRERGWPTPITTDVLTRGGVSDSLAPRTLQALKLLDLVDADGQPTDALDRLAKAPSSDFAGELAELVKGAYSEVFSFVDPSQDSAERVRDAFRSYTPRGQQGRMVTLFLGLCELAEIIPPQSGKRKSTNKTSRTATPRASKTPKATKTPPSSGAPREMETLPSPTGQHPLIRGLIQSLPTPGSAWSHESREAWVRAALANFELVYKLTPADQTRVDKE